MNKLNLIIPFMFMISMLMVMMITWINFHPTYLIMMLIMYSIMISMNFSLLKKNFMYSIMLIMFLIMISEVLIIFLYFSSLISNAKVSSTMSPKKLIYMALLLMLSTSIMWSFKFYKQPIMKCSEVSSIAQVQTSSFNNLEMIYLYPFNSMSILCMVFLLMSMLTIIKIISSKSSPLRKMS